MWTNSQMHVPIIEQNETTSNTFISPVSQVIYQHKFITGIKNMLEELYLYVGLF